MVGERINQVGGQGTLLPNEKCTKILRDKEEKEGKSMKRYWFNQRMRQLIREHYPDATE